MATRSIANELSRGAVRLEIDHHTVHHAPNTVSIHVEEKDTTGKTIRGLDVDGVTVEELGSTGEIAAAITGSKLVSFVTSISGLTTKVAELPPPPKVEEPAKEEGAAAPSAP